MFLSWPRHDQDAALALHQIEQDEQANKCSVCGGDARECQDPANGRAYEVKLARCYRTKAVGKTMQRREGDKDSSAVVASTIFHQERVKPPKS